MWFHQVQSQKIIRGWNLKMGRWKGRFHVENHLVAFQLQTSVGFHCWVSTRQHHQAFRPGEKTADLVCALMPITKCNNQQTHHESIPMILWIVMSPIRIWMFWFCVVCFFHYLFASTLRLLRFSWPVVVLMSRCPHWCIVDHILRHVLMPEWNKEMLSNMLWYYHGIGIYLEVYSVPVYHSVQLVFQVLNSPIRISAGFAPGTFHRRTWA